MNQNKKFVINFLKCSPFLHVDRLLFNLLLLLSKSDKNVISQFFRLHLDIFERTRIQFQSGCQFKNLIFSRKEYSMYF